MCGNELIALTQWHGLALLNCTTTDSWSPTIFPHHRLSGATSVIDHVLVLEAALGFNGNLCVGPLLLSPSDYTPLALSDQIPPVLDPVQAAIIP